MNNKAEKIKKILKPNQVVEFAYLFGSRAKGSVGERSDWDIAIYFKKDPRDLPSWLVFYLEAEISKEVGGEVQIVTLNNLDSPVFLFQIINNGVLLVDSNPENRILFEARVLSKYHDWQYFLKRQMA